MSISLFVSIIPNGNLFILGQMSESVCYLTLFCQYCMPHFSLSYPKIHRWKYMSAIVFEP